MNENFNNEQIENETPLQEEIPVEEPVIVIPPPSAEEIEQKAIKKLGIVSGTTLLSLTVLVTLVNSLSFYVLIFSGFSYDAANKFLFEPAIVQVRQIIFSLIVFLLPFAVVFKLFGYRISNLISFKKTEKGEFLPFFLLGMAFCSFANVASSYAGSIFESFGVNYQVNLPDEPKGIFGFLLTLVASAVVPPLVEEFAFRGVLLGALKKHGEGFAIVVTAILFGVMHSNFEQMFFAAIIGLILGFITVKTESIWPAIAIHAGNNLIPTVFSYIPDSVPQILPNLIYVIYLIAAFGVGVLAIFMLKKKEDIFALADSSTNNTLFQKSKRYFLAVPLLIYVIICFIESFAYFV